MFIDALLQFSDSQALTATAVSTNVIDTGPTASITGTPATLDRNVGMGEPMGVAINVEVAADFTSADETYQFDLQTDDADGFGSPVVIASRVIPAAFLVAGRQFVIPVPPDAQIERFLRMNYTLGGTTPSVTISAYLQPLSMLQNYVAYPDASPIS